MSTIIDTLSARPETAAVGWTLLHFVWQGGLAAMVLAVVLGLMRDRSPGARYLVCCGGMLAMTIMPIVTFFVVLGAGDIGPVSAGLALAVTAESTSLADRLSAWLPGLTMAWLAGACLLQSRLILLWTRAQRLKRCGTFAAPARLQSTVNELSVALGIRRPVTVVESVLASVPGLVGWLRPVILVPATAMTGLSPDQLRAILVHELAHVRRHDYLVNLVQAVFEALLFYHPAVWWLSNRLRVEREYCCDDVAVRLSGDAVRYAQALSTLETLRCDELQPVLASTGGPLMNRIRRLVSVRPAPREGAGYLAPLVLAGSMATAICAAGFALPAETLPDRTADRAEAPIEGVDLVGIVRDLGGDTADMVEALHASGVDNDVLMVILRQLGTQPYVIETIEKATELRTMMDDKARAVRARVHDDVATGRISEQDAADRLSRIDVEFEQHYAAGVEHRKMLARHIAELRESGLTEGEINEKLNAHRNRLHGVATVELVGVKEQLAERVHLQRLAELELQEMIESGAVDAATVELELAQLEIETAELERLHAGALEGVHEGELVLLERIHNDTVEGEWVAALEGDHAVLGTVTAPEKSIDLHFGMVEENLAHKEARLRHVADRIEAKVAAGAMSEADGRAKLVEVHRELEEMQSHLVFARQMSEAMHARAAEMKAEGLTEKEIKQRLHEEAMAAHGTIRLRQTARTDIMLAESIRVHAKLSAARDRIKADLASGAISTETADDRLRHLEDATAVFEARVHELHEPRTEER